MISRWKSAFRFCDATTKRNSEREVILKYLVDRKGNTELKKEDFYSLKWKEILQEKSLQKICRSKNRTHSAILINLFPEYQLLPWKFINTPKHYWKHAENQKKFLEWFKNEKQINSMEDWNRPNILNEIYNEGGRGLVKGIYHNSLSKTLQSNYPNENWNFIFTKPSNFWNNENNLKNSLTSLAEKLQIDVLKLNEIPTKTCL